MLEEYKQIKREQLASKMLLGEIKINTILLLGHWSSKMLCQPTQPFARLGHLAGHTHLPAYSPCSCLHSCNIQMSAKSAKRK